MRDANTIDAEVAVKVCEAIKPKKIIPKHYRTSDSEYSKIATVDEFLNLAVKSGLSEKIIG